MSEAREFTGVIMEIGYPGEMAETNARTVANTVKGFLAKPQPPVLEWSVGGYDEDPRELWNIPEARRYVLRCTTLCGFLTPDDPRLGHFGELSIALIRNCYAILQREMLTAMAMAVAQLDPRLLAMPVADLGAITLALFAGLAKLPPMTDALNEPVDVSRLEEIAAPIRSLPAWSASWPDSLLIAVIVAGFNAGAEVAEAEAAGFER